MFDRVSQVYSGACSGQSSASWRSFLQRLLGLILGAFFAIPLLASIAAVNRGA